MLDAKMRQRAADLVGWPRSALPPASSVRK
jgi:hypothetical protein